MIHATIDRRDLGSDLNKYSGCASSFVGRGSQAAEQARAEPERSAPSLRGANAAADPAPQRIPGAMPASDLSFPDQPAIDAEHVDQGDGRQQRAATYVDKILRARSPLTSPSNSQPNSNS
jgi:hypothetical protein